MRNRQGLLGPEDQYSLGAGSPLTWPLGSSGLRQGGFDGSHQPHILALRVHVAITPLCATRKVWGWAGPERQGPAGPTYQPWWWWGSGRTGRQAGRQKEGQTNLLGMNQLPGYHHFKEPGDLGCPLATLRGQKGAIGFIPTSPGRRTGVKEGRLPCRVEQGPHGETPPLPFFHSLPTRGVPLPRIQGTHLLTSS